MISEQELAEMVSRGCTVEGETAVPPSKKQLKYRNHPVTTDDGFFHSTGESTRWEILKGWEEKGKIRDLQRQVKIEIIDSAFWYSEARFLPPIFWNVDFLYYHNEISRWYIEDWKSEVTRKLPDYKMKRQLFLIRYPDFLYIETKKGETL